MTDIDKILKFHQSDKINYNRVLKCITIFQKYGKDEYYNEVRKMTEKIKSDHAINNYQRIAEYVFDSLSKISQ